MPVFLCRWPNGDFSVVKARNKEDAICELDEIENAEGCPLIPLKEFMMHFVLTGSGKFKVEGFGEVTGIQIMGKAYPLLDQAQAEAPTNRNDQLTKKGRMMIRKAVARERRRVIIKPSPKPETLRGEHIKSQMNAPTVLVDRIVKQVGQEVLAKFKGSGKTN